MVEDLPDLPPEAQDDSVVVGRDELGEDGVVVVEVLGNDLDPEGEPLTLVTRERSGDGCGGHWWTGPWCSVRRTTGSAP